MINALLKLSLKPNVTPHSNMRTGRTQTMLSILNFAHIFYLARTFLVRFRNYSNYVCTYIQTNKKEKIHAKVLHGALFNFKYNEFLI